VSSPPETELPADLTEVVRHLEAMYPQEGCGVLLRHGQRGTWRVRPITNAYDRYHALEPVRFPRTSRTAYFFEPREWLLVNQEADAHGERVACVFHSHTNGIADFSAEDRAQAAPAGLPVLPGVSYLVVAIEGGHATHARLFWWQEEDFLDRPVTL
jgi:proteasome lid subunit RPN8/RPN11